MLRVPHQLSRTPFQTGRARRQAQRWLRGSTEWAPLRVSPGRGPHGPGCLVPDKRPREVAVSHKVPHLPPMQCSEAATRGPCPLFSSAACSHPFPQLFPAGD